VIVGLLGVVVFALSLPMTRLAVGTPEAPQLSGVYVATRRATVAGLLSAVYLLAVRAPWPQRQHWGPLGMVAMGVVFGFPLCTSIAMRHVQAVHASVILGILPLATTVVGAWLHRQRPSLGFWICAALGSALVMAFAVLRSGQAGLRVSPADGLLLLAMVCAAVGYGFGAKLSHGMPPAHVICWALLIGLPLNIPMTLSNQALSAITPVAWLGFFALHRGLALGGTVRVSQVQLLQPFLSMLFAVPLLGEHLDALSLGFGLAVIAVVFLGRRQAVHSIPVPTTIQPSPLGEHPK